MKLRTLQPRLRAASASRPPVLTAQPGRIERKRGSAGVRDRNAIRKRDQHCCRICGRLGTVVDHIVPLWKGGSDTNPGREVSVQCTLVVDHTRLMGAERTAAAGHSLD